MTAEKKQKKLSDRYRKPVEMSPILKDTMKKVRGHVKKNGGKLYEVVSELIEIGLKQKEKKHGN